MIVVDSDIPESPIKSPHALADVRGDPGASDSAPPPPPPAYPGQPSYQAYKPAPIPYTVTSPIGGAAPNGFTDVQPESAGRRFFKAFGIALAIWILLGVFTQSVVDVGTVHVRQPYRNQAIIPTIPKSDGNPALCHGGFDHWKTGVPSNDLSFTLPVSADSLFVASRGTLAAGNVYLVQGTDLSQTDIKIDMTIFTDVSQEALDSIKVCKMERAPGQVGVTIYSPEKWVGRSEHVRFNVTVQFPISSNEYPLPITSFETGLGIFRHHVGDLHGKVAFDSLHLQASNAWMSAESVGANTLHVKTSNGRITGTYHASTYLLLSTSNGRITATPYIYHDGERSSATQLEMRTSNGQLTAPVHLISTADSGEGGLFTVKARTSNAALNASVPAIPLDARVRVDAATSNGRAGVRLAREFEGAFDLRTSNARADLEYEASAADPAGRNRVRQITLVQQQRAIRGSVGWDDARGQGKGEVTVRTSNAPVTLELPWV